MQNDLNPTPYLKFLTWKQMIKTDIPPPEYLVEGLVPLRGVTLVTGEGGIGKSFMLMEMAYAVGSGSRFLGKFGIDWGAVVVLDLENDDATVVRRAQKILAGHRAALGRTCTGEEAYGHLCDQSKSHICDFTLPIYVLSKRELASAELLIDREHGRQALVDIVEFYSPSLLVIDPLTAIHSTDENDNIAMRQVIMLLQWLAREYHLAVVVVHHPRKRGVINDAGQMIRGASDLRNAVDSHVFLRKLSDTALLLEHDKSRHAPSMGKFTVEMSDTEDGTGTVFTYIDTAPEGGVRQAEAAEAVLAILKEVGTCKRNELIIRAKADGIARTTLDRTLGHLMESGQIEKSSYGLYTLARQPLLKL